jgi:uncharacterized protein YrrD
MRIDLGKPVKCADDRARKLVDVVIEAKSNRVTHLVVQPDDELEAARLVPIELAHWPGPGREISLRCNAETLEQLEPVREYAYLRPGEHVPEDPKWDTGVEDFYPSSYYNPSDFAYAPDLDPGVGVRYDRVPKGEIELRHASAVYSADQGHLGHVEGVLVDGADLVTHLLLERGHLWWRREVAVPVEVVGKFETDVVRLRVPKSELKRFPSRRRR